MLPYLEKMEDEETENRGCGIEEVGGNAENVVFQRLKKEFQEEMK